MIYRHLTLSGFGPYHETEHWDIPTGLTMITGKNGTGKSTIIDAIHWALYGPRASLRSARDRSSIINRQSQTARVELEFEQDDDIIVISRTLNRTGKHSLSLEINEEEYEDTLTNLQKYITDIIGVDADVFTATCMITSSSTLPMNTFLVASPSEKKEILSHIVDPLGVWESANKTMRKRLREEKDTLIALTSRREMLTEMIAALDPPTPPDNCGGDLSDLEETRRSLERRIDDSGSAESLRRVKEMTETLARLHHRHEETLSEHESVQGRIDDITKFISDTEETISDLDESLSSFDVRIDTLDAEITCGDHLMDHLRLRLEESAPDVEPLSTEQRNMFINMVTTHDLLCQECGSALSPEILEEESEQQSQRREDRERIDGLTLYVDTLMTQADALEIDRKKVFRQRTDLSTALRDKITERKELRVKSRELDESLDTLEDRITMVEEELAEPVDTEVSVMAEKLSDITDKIAEISRYQQRMKSYTEQEGDLTDQLSEIEEQVCIQEVIVDHFTSLVRITSPDGEVSHQIRDLCDRIGEHARTALHQCYDIEADVQIESGKDIVITVNGRDLTSYSHGQQSRVIPAVLSGLTEQVYHRRGVFLPPLWDEPSIAVDTEDVEKMISMVSSGDQALVILRETDYDAPSHIVARAPRSGGL